MKVLVKKPSLRSVVEKLGGEYFVFKKQNNASHIRSVWAKPASKERQATFIKQFSSKPTATGKYELEYTQGLYESFKPGIDDSSISRLVGFDVSDAVVIEIGGGPSYIAELGANGVSVDIADHPRLKKKGIGFIKGDVCAPAVVRQVETYLKKQKITNRPTLVVLSYVLDRVPNQYLALRHFAELIKKTNGVGLITVNLPARPSSSGVLGLKYATNKKNLVASGREAVGDYQQIVKATMKEGLRLWCGGRTRHYGRSIEGIANLPCYCMVFIKK